MDILHVGAIVFPGNFLQCTIDFPKVKFKLNLNPLAFEVDFGKSIVPWADFQGNLLKLGVIPQNHFLQLHFRHSYHLVMFATWMNSPIAITLQYVAEETCPHPPQF